MEEKTFEAFKQKLNREVASLHIQEVVPAQEIKDLKSEKKVYRNKEKSNPVTRQLNVEVSEQIFIKLKTRAVEERVALRNLVEEALFYFLNQK